MKNVRLTIPWSFPAATRRLHDATADRADTLLDGGL